MIVRTLRVGVARCALAFLFVVGFVPSASAAFTVTFNGTTTVTDNGAGDTDSRVGFIAYENTNLGGYHVLLTSSTDASRPTADLTTSQLRIVNNSGTSASLNVVVSEAFNVPTFVPPTMPMDLANTLTRNIVAGLGTSGNVSSTTSVTSGGTGSTTPVSLNNAVDSGMSFGQFDRTSEFYTLVQNIAIAGLVGQNGVTITASSFASARGQLVTVPAPPAVGLMASGMMFLGLFGLRVRRQRRATT